MSEAVRHVPISLIFRRNHYANSHQLEQVTQGQYAFVVGWTFPAVDHDRTVEWKPRRIPGRCLIKIGAKPLSYEALDEKGQERVPAGEPLSVYEMDVRLVSPS